jgi:hypothetical protein
MPRRATVAKLCCVLAALAAFTWTTAPYSDRLLHARARRSLFGPNRTSSFFAASLPDSLKPPSIDLSRTFLSLIAADIDADGDLDVVGIDEFRKLVVWENDGTGHLTRKHPTQRDGAGASRALPWVIDQPATTQASMYHRSAPLGVLMVRCADACGYLPRSNATTAGPLSPTISTNSPRAPPAPNV